MTEQVEVPSTAEKKPRRKFRNSEWTEDQVKARKAELTLEAVPEGWVTMSEVDKLCKEQGIPISKLVRATGGDRGMDKPLDSVFEIRYIGRNRYLHPDVKTKGIELLKTKEFGATQRKPRQKKEKAEGETGPVADAKVAKQKATVKAAPAPAAPETPRTSVWTPSK